MDVHSETWQFSGNIGLSLLEEFLCIAENNWFSMTSQ